MARSTYSQTSRSQSNSSRGGSQSMMKGWAETAKERPMATAAAAAAAVGAGAFLWSKRNQISDQISHMSERARLSGSSHKTDGGSSRFASGHSSSPMGAEPGYQPQMAGAGTGSMGSSSAPRATGGRSGKAQSGQTMSPSRDASPTSSL